MQMFNLTEYISGLMVNDPAMFLVQFVILPFATIAGLLVIHAWYADRKDKNNNEQITTK